MTNFIDIEMGQKKKITSFSFSSTKKKTITWSQIGLRRRQKTKIL